MMKQKLSLLGAEKSWSLKRNNSAGLLGNFDAVEETETVPTYLAFTDFYWPDFVTTTCGGFRRTTAQGLFVEPSGSRAEDGKGLFFTRLASTSPGDYYSGRPTGQLGNMRRNTGSAVTAQFKALDLATGECGDNNSDDYYWFETVISCISSLGFNTCNI